MSKRENDGEITEISKQQKLNDVNPRGTAAAAVDGQNEEPPPPAPPAIFKLNAICCDDLFEWLSLKDLHSLGQTCKRMQRLTGVYFQENYKETRLRCINRNIYHNKIMMNKFFPYVQKIEVVSNRLSDFKSINDGDSISDISLDWFKLTKSLIGCIKEKLNQIEVLHLHYLNIIKIHLYEDFLQFCPNLKGLCVSYSDSKDNDDKWMNRKYPKLQHFRLQNEDDLISHNLRHFFQQNDQLQSFGTNDRFLLTNSDTFINSNLKLDILYIQYSGGDLEHVCDLLNNLHEIGFYKRLEFYSFGSPISQAKINQIATLHSLDNLAGYFDENLVLPPIISLKKLSIHNSYLEHINLEVLTQQFPNLRKVHLDSASTNKLQPFVRHLLKLKELSIKFIDASQIDLSALNEERRKLSGACELTIYVQENIYLETKMATKNLYTNHDLIKIKRIESSKLNCSQNCL